jgi:hypothetical protein
MKTFEVNIFKRRSRLRDKQFLSIVWRLFSDAFLAGLNKRPSQHDKNTTFLFTFTLKLNLPKTAL